MFKESTASNQDKIKYKENESNQKISNLDNNKKTSLQNKIEDKKNTLEKAINDKTITNVTLTNGELENDFQNCKINSHIKIEIEHLDEEIKELQNKLKTMIQNKNN